MKPPLPPIEGTKIPLEHSELNKPHEKKSHAYFNRAVASLEGIPVEMLQKILSYLPIHDLNECRLINRYINNAVDNSPLLPLAIWKHTPPSVRIFYTEKQYNLRHRPYLTYSNDYESVKKYEDKSKTAAFFSPRLFFDMKKRLITANNFTCRKIMTCSDHLKYFYHKDFYHIVNEHSLCLLIEKNPKEDTMRDVVEIDIHGKSKHDTICYDSKIIDTTVCKNSGRITTILEDDSENHYIELHKFNKGKWTSIFKNKCYLGKNDSHPHDSCNYVLTDDHRSLALKSNDSTILICKENYEGKWIDQFSIPCCNNITGMTLSCDGNHLIIQTDTKAQLWKIDAHGDPKQLYEKEVECHNLFFSRDGQFFIECPFLQPEKSIKIYALSGDEYQGKLPMQMPQTTISNMYTSVHLSDDCSTLLLKPYKKNTFHIYEKNRADDLYPYNKQDLTTGPSSYRATFPFSQNGNSFAVCKSITELEIWQKNKGKWWKKITTPHLGIISISFNSNCTCLVTIPECNRLNSEDDPAHSTNNQTSFPINVLKLNCEGEWIVREFFETGPVRKIEWLSDNNNFLTILEDGSINQWAIMPEISMTDDAEDMQY